MKYFITVSFLFSVLIAFAQQTTRGIQPSKVDAQSQQHTNVTYAVVVGISDYQDPGIPDLRFAHKDAEAFANYLRSNAGGSLDADHLKVLLNEKATVAQFAIALDWLMEVAKENDQVLIYFSGHGDVEKKTITQPGYLLCWDAPSRVYLAGGALALPMFQDIITTLSSQNKAKVVVITDACRSGKLAGSSVGGSQITGANLAKQYANEVKILSCQPNEYSIEGEQWGGGRGVFSYHLLDALYGMADNNSDQVVNVMELGRYLEDHVTNEVAPQSQVPMIIGVKSEKMALVNPTLLASLRKAKEGQLIAFAATDSRGLEEDILQKVDSSVRILYQEFYEALKTKHFFKPQLVNAEDLFIQLSGIAELGSLQQTMRRNYAAALQDDAQQVMNKWLKSDLSEMLSQKKSIEKYKTYPRYLERAAELLGEHHYMYKVLNARKHFFNGYLLALYNENPDQDLGHRSIEQFQKALQLQPDSPLAYWQMSSVYAFNLLKLDSAEYYAQKAIEMNPYWTLPYTNIAFILSEKYKQYDRAKAYLEQASSIDTSSANLCNAWGLNHNNAKEYAQAEKQLQKAIQLDSTYIGAYNNLSFTYYYTNRFQEAEVQLLKAIKLDSTFDYLYTNLANVFMITERYDKAIKLYEKVVQLDSTESSAYHNLGYLYRLTIQYEAAKPLFKKAIQLDSTYTSAYNNLAIIFLSTKKFDDAEYHFKKVIALDSSAPLAYYNLGVMYMTIEKFEEAEKLFKKAVTLDSLFLNAYINLGDLYTKTKRLAEAEQTYLKAIKINAKDIDLNYALACLFVQKSKIDLAFYYFEQCIQNGYQDYDWILKDSDLALLREQTDRWNALMKKYFPDKFKD